MLEAMPKLYNHWQTLRILINENWRSAKAAFRLRSWHPIRRVKTTLITFVVRIWGRAVTRKMKRPIRTYLAQIPPVDSRR
jgi:hypothetical protein